MAVLAFLRMIVKTDRAASIKIVEKYFATGVKSILFDRICKKYGKMKRVYEMGISKK